MKLRIALFGPPACGKSSLVDYARKQGLEAYDLEEIREGSRKAKLETIIADEKSDLVLYGTADLQPTDFPGDTVHVLILPTPKEEYIKRLQQRDKTTPRKAGQHGDKTYELFAGWLDPFDIVYRKIGKIEDTLREIIEIAGKYADE